MHRIERTWRRQSRAGRAHRLGSAFARPDGGALDVQLGFRRDENVGARSFRAHRRALRIALAVLAVALGAAAAPATSPAAACTHASAMGSAAAEADLPEAVRCLVNAQRAARGMPALRASGRLTMAAQRHSADMVRRRYFEHVTPDGRTLTDRVRSTGYLTGTGDWALGEDIAWGTGELGSPAAIVRSWMESPPHRAVILGRPFREAGVGIARGAPVDGVAGADTGATFVLDAGMALQPPLPRAATSSPWSKWAGVSAVRASIEK